MKKLIYVLLSLCAAGISISPKIAIASWRIEAVDAPKHICLSYPRAIAVDGSNNPHIAYGCDNLYYAYYGGSIWHYETVDTQGNHSSLALDGNGPLRFFHLGCSTEIVMTKRLQRIVEFIYERHAGGDIEPDDIPVAYLVEILHQCPQRVAVRADKDTLSGADVGGNALVPVRQYAHHRVFETFGKRHLTRGKSAVTRVAAWVARIVRSERRR